MLYADAMNQATSERPREALFLAHALEPDALSTTLIAQRLAAIGREWPDPRPFEPFSWLQFHFCPVDGRAVPVHVDFQIFPISAEAFFKSVKVGAAFPRVAAATRQLLARSTHHPVLGWGAFTKHATMHGAAFLAATQTLADRFSSTHGDAGTVALVFHALLQADVGPSDRVAIIGASGAIGTAIARMVQKLDPRELILVGRGDEPGSTVNQDRLRSLASTLRGSVSVDQDKSLACLTHDASVVIVATAGSMTLCPSEVPANALVLDVTTPSACRESDGWTAPVIRAGCAQFSPECLPNDFGTLGARTLRDVGAGGDLVIWGCTAETVARASTGWRGHVVGQDVNDADVSWCAEMFPLLGINPQAPRVFGRLTSWDELKRQRGRRTSG